MRAWEHESKCSNVPIFQCSNALMFQCSHAKLRHFGIIKAKGYIHIFKVKLIWPKNLGLRPIRSPRAKSRGEAGLSRKSQNTVECFVEFWLRLGKSFTYNVISSLPEKSCCPAIIVISSRSLSFARDDNK